MTRWIDLPPWGLEVRLSECPLGMVPCGRFVYGGAMLSSELAEALGIGGVSYYERPGSLRQIIRRWQDESAKLYDHVMPLMIPVKDLWQHREYTWTRDKARRSPEEWDALVEQMKKGWSRKAPLLLTVGRQGGVKVGEGNHRLAIAKLLGFQKVPVSISFYNGRVTKTKLGPAKPARPAPAPPKRRSTEPLTPGQKKQVDDLMDLLGM